MAVDAVTHPAWCSAKHCTAGQPGGRHRGLVTPVGSRPVLTTVYVEDVEGGLRVCLATGPQGLSFTPEDAARVAVVLAEVAAEATRLDLRV